MVLGIKDLKDVRALLFAVRKKWYNIGIELGLNVDKLDVIESKHEDDPDRCLVEMIKMWLKSINPSPIWSTLACALRADAVNEVVLADEGKMLHPCLLFNPYMSQGVIWRDITRAYFHEPQVSEDSLRVKCLTI
jgi:hypothetical protein